jgi:hypothetical protein
MSSKVIDHQCICHHKIKSWSTIGPYVRSIRLPLGFLLGITVLSLVFGEASPETRLSQQFLAIAVAVASIYILIFLGLILAGHSYACAGRLGFLRMLLMRPSLRSTTSKYGPADEEESEVSPATLAHRRDLLLLVVGSFGVVGAGVHLFTGTDNVTSSILFAVFSATLLAFSLMPSTKGKPFESWPNPLQVLARIVCFIGLASLLTSG